MKSKTFIKECKCSHCQQKLEQINSSRLYWDKLVLSKNFTQYFIDYLNLKAASIGKSFKIFFEEPKIKLPYLNN